MFKRSIYRAATSKSGELSNCEEANDVDITPMLDVVFIMLIFFVVTASFVRESGIDINKPVSSPTDERPADMPIVVEIGSDNQIQIQSIGVSQSAIKATIVRLRAESPDSAVVVRLHPKSNTKSMIAAIDAIRSADVPFPSVDLIRG